MPDNAQSGARVRQLRDGKGWSQQRLAHEAGVAISTVARWEGGAPPVRYPILNAIARALGITVDTLMDDDESAA